jgi:hypothetical protein
MDWTTLTQAVDEFVRETVASPELPAATPEPNPALLDASIHELERAGRVTLC